MNKQARILLILILIITAMYNGVACASDDKDSIIFTRLSGMVSEVKGAYFVVSSQKITLMDIMYEGKRYQTKITGANGHPIKASEVRKGDNLDIIGQKMPDGTILANDIHLMMHE